MQFASASFPFLLFIQILINQIISTSRTLTISILILVIQLIFIKPFMASVAIISHVISPFYFYFLN